MICVTPVSDDKVVQLSLSVVVVVSSVICVPVSVVDSVLDVGCDCGFDQLIFPRQVS